MEWISNDFERQLRYKIAHYDYLDTFPKMANFGVNQSDFLQQFIIKKIKQKRLKNMYHPQIERYIEAVNLFSVKQ